MSERAQALEAALDEVGRFYWGLERYNHQPFREAMAKLRALLVEAPPVGVSPQPERFVDPEPECPGPECSRCSGEYCDVHITDPCDCDVAERHANDIGKPASLSPVESTPSREPLTGAELLDRFRPVEPTPEPPRDDFTAPLPPRPPAVVKPQRYDLVRYGVTWEGQDNQPLLTPMPDGYWTPWHLAVEPPSVEPAPPTPAPCVWREDAVRAYHPACWTEASHDHHEIYQWEFCPYCGHPLQITR